MNKSTKIALASTALATTVLTVGTLIGEIIKVKKYVVEVDDLDSKIDIVALSDLHNMTSIRRLKIVYRKIKSVKPDVILLVGDINTTKNIFQYYDFLQDLTNIAKVYYVRGNHDNDYGNYEAFNTAIKYLGIKVLEDESDIFNINGVDLNIIGIDDRYVRGIGLRKSLMNKEIDRAGDAIVKNYKPDLINVVMSHRPNYVLDAIELENIIAFAGHTHGGQFRIPFTSYGVLTPNQGILAKYSYGGFPGNNSVLIINSGLGNHWHLPRMFNPREIVHLQIVQNKK